MAIFPCLLLSFVLNAQSVRVTGLVNTIHGESLPSAQVFILPDSIGVLTDIKGNFSIDTKPGKKILMVSFVGFQNHQEAIDVYSDRQLKITLKEKLNELEEVVVEDARDHYQDLFESNQTSTNIIDKEDITSIPVLGGEADVIKTLQLLPGTVRGVEGSSDLFIRGGAADQNLVLLDEAPVYNTSHLFGFLSVFNPDILDKVESINGGFPARYGGRLSSILNVEALSEIPEKTQLSGDIGLIASRLMVEQPIVKDKASFWIAGRRTYIDQVVRAVGEELPYFFYDVNAKVILHPDQKNQIELSYYGGEDILDIFRDGNNDGNGILSSYVSGNDSQSLIWRREISTNLTSKLSLIRSRYKYDITNRFEENSLLASSDIQDVGARWLIEKDSIFNGTLTSGAEWTRHTISPNVVNTSGIIAEILQSNESSGRIADEFATYVDYTWHPIDKLQLTTGFRATMAVVRNRNYFNPEPRFSARYEVTSEHALKFSYSRMAQYIHRISNSAVTTPTDIWYPVTSDVQPQTSNQVAFAWQYAMPERKSLLSIEGYYKTLEDLIGFEEGTNLFLNTEFESKLVQGEGKAYGIEFLLRKDAGKFSGWISYTLSWSWRRFDEIAEGNWFPSRYDRRNNGAIVTQYAFNKRWSASLVWEYISGSRFTPVIGQYIILAPTLTGVDLLPQYSEINGVRLADTHRLDLGLKFRSKPGKKFMWHWFAGVYNVYNRATPIGIIISEDETTGALSYQQPGLFGLLPFISYGFKL